MANGFVKTNGEIDWDALRIMDNNQVLVGTTTNSGNRYSVSLTPAPTSYKDIMGITVKINADSTGVPTLNVNGLGAVSLKKANGLDVTNLKANGVYTFRYNSATGNFILQGEGGSGNLQPNQALAGFTFTNDNGEQVGTGDPDLIANNIVSGISIFDVLGIVTPLTISAGDMLIISSTTEKTTSSTIPVLIKEIKYTAGSGTARIKFLMKTTGGGVNTHGRIYVNGIARGILQTFNGNYYMTYSEDISINNNDLIQIYAYSDNSGIPCYIKDFSLYLVTPSIATINLE